MVNTVCNNCGEPISVKNDRYKKRKKHFCSRSCYFDYRRSLRPTAKCAFCGKEITMPKSQYDRAENHYCSATCRNRYNNPEKNKTLMTESVRLAIREKRLEKYGVEEPKGYRKNLGRLEHRKVAEEILGRPLKPEEVVHHIDGNKDNNSPENLFVFPSNSAHSSYHAKLRKGTAPKLIGGEAQCIMYRDDTK